jgi:hypothetical protein
LFSAAGPGCPAPFPASKRQILSKLNLHRHRMNKAMEPGARIQEEVL